MGRDDENSEKPRGVMDRISLSVTLVAVSVFAIFTGYLVGQYAISWVASPLGETPRLEDAGVRLQEPAASSTSSAGQSGTRTPTPAPTASSASSPATQSSAATTPAPSTTAAPAPASAASSNASTVMRVHVGRYATRDQAVSAADSLRTGTPAIPDAWVLFDQQSGEYRVQVGAFTSEARAREFVGELTSRGFDAFIAR